MQRYRVLVVLATLWMLVACALLPERTKIPPTEAQLVGRYEFGHSGFHETVVLATDGSFSRTLHPHLSDHSKIYKGGWKLEGEMLHFQYDQGSEAGSESLRQAEVFWRGSNPAFVNLDDLKGDKVHEWWVYDWRGVE